MKSFIEKLNKAELHLHLEGSLELAMMLKLADKHKVQLPYNTVEAIEKAYKFNCLQDFLNIYYQGMDLLEHLDYMEILAYLQGWLAVMFLAKYIIKYLFGDWWVLSVDFAGFYEFYAI